MEGDTASTPQPAATGGRKRRGRRPAATPADGAAKSGGRKRAPDDRVAFDASVRNTIAARCGGEGAADAVLGSQHFDQILRSFHAMRGSVGGADDKCADVIIDALATERAGQLNRAQPAGAPDVPADVAAGQRPMFDDVPRRPASGGPASDAEVTEAVAGR